MTEILVVEIHFPSQCVCGHIFLEKFKFKHVTKEGFGGFCWCGFCCKKLMVKPMEDKDV